MRMDGSTRPAPHHYVEALMKKISFPRLFCSIEFGKIVNVPNLAYVLILVTIHNLSKFIHDKNVRYRLMSKGADILDPQQTAFKGFTNSAFITNDATALLLYNMAIFKKHVLVVERSKWSFKEEVDLMLIVWGELSPAISCKYKVHISCDERSREMEYTLEKLHDNIYLMDKDSENPKADKERVAIENSNVLEIYSSKFQIENIFWVLNQYK